MRHTPPTSHANSHQATSHTCKANGVEARWGQPETCGGITALHKVVITPHVTPDRFGKKQLMESTRNIIRDLAIEHCEEEGSWCLPAECHVGEDD